jgi:ribosome-binding protein aMBF1 (putative translation factor)
MIDTKARKQLEAALDEPGRTQVMLARALKVSGPAVNAWVAGRTRPESHLRRALEKLLGIPALDWDTDAEREQYANAVASGRSILQPEAA